MQTIMKINPITLRPNSLNDVAYRVNEYGHTFNSTLREFLDEFYRHPEHHAVRLQEEPERIDEIEDAYLAAVAEHLSQCWQVPCPDWVSKPYRFLHRPYFAGGLESLKATLLVESPVAFRRRMIFVSANALSRASQFAERV